MWWEDGRGKGLARAHPRHFKAQLTQREVEVAWVEAVGLFFGVLLQVAGPFSDHDLIQQRLDEGHQSWTLTIGFLSLHLSDKLIKPIVDFSCLTCLVRLLF